MTKKQEIQLFNDRRIRTVWDDKEEKWYFSVVDVIEALTDSPDPSTYWRVLKNRLKKEGNETVTICNAFKLPARDGKMRLTPIADQEQLFRLIQSIPSPKAEPFKVWIAQVASERLDEMQDPELTIERAMTDYRRLGYSEAWINQRLKSIEVRKELTDEWKRCGVEAQQYASLTDIVTMAWAGKTTRSYKAFKGLTKQNLRDNMTNVELALNTLAEAATTELSKEMNPATYRENVMVARKGGSVAKAARKQLEDQLGRPSADLNVGFFSLVCLLRQLCLPFFVCFQIQLNHIQCKAQYRCVIQKAHRKGEVGNEVCYI